MWIASPHSLCFRLCYKHNESGVQYSGQHQDIIAIRVELPFIDTIGYVANSVGTVFAGTCSAGRLYDKFEDYAYAQVMFITHSSVIAIVVPKEEVEKKDAPDIDPNTMQAEPRNIGMLKAKIGF
jgi:homoaconitase/3-isopropylmalate dehydratase large subunit